MQIIAANTACSPVHAHSCTNCTYLGTAIFYGKTFDFWTHNIGPAGATVMCRWSSADEDCFSAPVRLARMMKNDTLYTYAASLYDQWDGYMEDMGYRDYGL